MLVIVLVYALYDELGDQINKRRAAISRQFPNVVSKLALLVTSGMIMDRAWRETAQSQSGELYMEMRKTSEELANLVEPAAAYAGFIDRCNTKETTKLASAIIQNQTKGNAEVGVLLKAMAHEAWQERRHTAKRADDSHHAAVYCDSGNDYGPCGHQFFGNLTEDLPEWVQIIQNGRFFGMRVPGKDLRRCT